MRLWLLGEVTKVEAGLKDLIRVMAERAGWGSIPPTSRTDICINVSEDAEYMGKPSVTVRCEPSVWK